MAERAIADTKATLMVDVAAAALRPITDVYVVVNVEVADGKVDVPVEVTVVVVLLVEDL